MPSLLLLIQRYSRNISVPIFTAGLWMLAHLPQGWWVIVPSILGFFLFSLSTGGVLSGLLILGFFQFAVPIGPIPIDGERATLAHIGLLAFAIWIAVDAVRKSPPSNVRNFRRAMLVWFSSATLLFLVSVGWTLGRVEIHWLLILFSGFVGAYVGFYASVNQITASQGIFMWDFVAALSTISFLQLFVIPLAVHFDFLDHLHLVEFVQPNPGSSVALAILFFLGLGWFLYHSSQLSSRVFSTVGGLLTFGVVFAGSRVVWASTIFLFIVLVFKAHRLRLGKRTARQLTGLFSMAFLTLGWSYALQQLMVPDLPLRPLRNRVGQDAILTNVRFEFWPEYTSYFVENPIFGIGFETDFTYASHSVWLFILVHFGLLGFLLTVIPVLICILRGIRSAFVDPMARAVVIGVLVILTFSNWYIFVFPYLWFFSGLAIADMWLRSSGPGLRFAQASAVLKGFASR